MSSEKVTYDVADNPGAITPPQTSSVAESGVDTAHEKKIMCVFQHLLFFLSTALIQMMGNKAARLTFASFRFSLASILFP